MPTRRFAALLAVLVAVLVLVALTRPTTPGASAAPPTTATGPATAPTTTMVDNPFLPEDVDLSECISAAPRPGCGSEARGGWRQTLVFGVMALGLLLIAWRIATGIRRREPTA